MRYAVRRQQAQLLYPLLWQEGLAGLPHHVDDLYVRQQDKLRLTWNGPNTIFDYFALRRIAKRISMRGAGGKAEASAARG